mgnify:FL=1
MATFTVVKEKDAPKPMTATATTSKRRQAEYDAYLKALKKGQVGRLAPSNGESVRAISSRISRAAGRAGVTAEVWAVDGSVYFRVG